MEFHRWKVEVTTLKNRKKDQRSTFLLRWKMKNTTSGAIFLEQPQFHPLRWKVKGHVSRSNVKWRLLVDKSCTSGAIWRIEHVLVASYFLKWRPLVDRSCISVALLRTIHELILSKFVCLIFLITSKWR